MYFEDLLQQMKMVKVQSKSVMLRLDISEEKQCEPEVLLFIQSLFPNAHKNSTLQLIQPYNLV